MKKNRKLLMTLLMVLLMALALVFAGCGGPSTLEEFIESDPEVQEEIDSIASAAGMEIEVKENNMTFTYAFVQTFDEATIASLQGDFESQMDIYGSTFDGLVSDLEEETGIDGITLTIIYVDGAGTELYQADF